MVRGIDRPEREQYLLITLKYGDSTVDRYTDWDRDVGEFQALPAIETKLPPNLGTFEQREGRILMPSTEPLPAKLGDHLHDNWPVFVTIHELSLGLFAGDEALSRVIFKGRAVRSIANFQNRRQTTALFLLSQKSRMAQIRMGIQCNHHCVNRLFGPGCELVQSNHEENGVIASLDGSTATLTTPNAAITAPTSPGGTIARYWERGYIQYDNLRIPIKKWLASSPDEFVLRRRPPSYWVGPSLLFVPGCHKTVEDCRAVWNNEGGNNEKGLGFRGGFLGAGYAIPAYNPIFETGS